MNWQPEPYWQFWQRLVDPPLPPEPPTGWQVQKQLNRLAKRVTQIKSGRLVPTVAYKLTGDFGRDLREAHTFLAAASAAGKGGEHGG